MRLLWPQHVSSSHGNVVSMDGPRVRLAWRCQTTGTRHPPLRMLARRSSHALCVGGHEAPPYSGERLLSSGVRPCIGCCLLCGRRLESPSLVMPTGVAAVGALSPKSPSPSATTPSAAVTSIKRPIMVSSSPWRFMPPLGTSDQPAVSDGRARCSPLERPGMRQNVSGVQKNCSPPGRRVRRMPPGSCGRPPFVLERIGNSNGLLALPPRPHAPQHLLPAATPRP